jgi:cyclopropane fatty-acyl-phospholipid synthase-like methyltransferase
MNNITKEYFQIKDLCRQGLLKYLAKAFSFIPKTEDPAILDIGCGTGVPTVWLAENLGGSITAIDTDKDSLSWLREKIKERKLENLVTVFNISVFDLTLKVDPFDIILAEGVLTVVGFGKAFPGIIGMLRKNGYFIIHDEYKDHREKCDFISNNHCQIISTLFLDEGIWWNDYYKHLETDISSVKDKQIRDLFRSDLKEIELYRKNPKLFRSIYYIIKKLS